MKLLLGVVTLFFSSLVVASQAPTADQLYATDWSQFRVTWPKFSSLPTTQAEAESIGWAPVGNTTCEADGFYGVRYALDGDLSTMILFDPNGALVGIQAGTVNPPPSAKTQETMFRKEEVESQTIFTLTAYLREPSEICSNVGRDNKIGDKLVLQVGELSTGENAFMRISPAEDDVTSGGTQSWVKGKCFKTMGMHYWYNISADMDCADIMPLFLLFNKGKLNAFGWVFIDTAKQPGGRWEHPSGSPLKLFLPDDQAPKCLFEKDVVLSTQHIYFTVPLFDFC